VEAYSGLQNILHEAFARAWKGSHKNYELLRIVDRRLLLDLEWQILGHKSVEIELLAAVQTINKYAQEAQNLPDLYDGVLQVLTGIDGMEAAFIARLDKQGRLEIEASAGKNAGAYLGAMQDGTIPQIHVREDDPTPGPVAKAWLTGTINKVAAYATDPSLAPWQNFGSSLGFRSSSAIPLVDDEWRSFALISLYSRWPGFFHTSMHCILLQQIQTVISAAARMHSRQKVIPLRLRMHYGELLRRGRVVVEYQPILDLRHGTIAKLEALARLQDNDGLLIFPGEFINSFGNNDLLHLFQIVLSQISVHCRSWEQEGWSFLVSINFPPQGIFDTRYHDALFSTLEIEGLNPRQIEIEILETETVAFPDVQDRFFQRLRAAGIRLVQDDLGSGHSSLLRMDRIQFDGVKIDQGLIRGAIKRDPWRALKFIYHLTDLAHSFGILVTAEGLETECMIEAAAILGVDFGQGYGIARPMPSSHVMNWSKRHNLQAQEAHPKTMIGILAEYLIWDHTLKLLAPKPDLVAEFLRQTNPIQRYIEHSPSQNSLLRKIVVANMVAAGQDVIGSAYRKTQHQLIQVLIK